MNYLQYMKPGSKFWAMPNGSEDISWSEFWNNWKQAIEKAKDQIIDKWENLKQDYKDAADPIAASERRQAESIEATRAKQASMKFVSDNRTDYEKKRDRKNLELKEFEQKEQLNKDATDAVMWTLTGPVYAVQHLASPNGVVKTYGNTKAAVQNGGGPYIEKAVASAAGDVLDASIVGVPLWNAARPYAVGLYNTTNYSSLGNRLAHPIESLRFAKINTKLSDLVKQAYPKETAKFMLEEASPLFKTVRYYNKGNSGPLYIGGTEVPLLIEGLRNTPTTTVKMWDRAHEYGHLFDDALRRLDVGMARGSFGLNKEGISLVPKNYTYSPGIGINTPRGQMEFMADNIASSIYPEPKHVGMLHGEVAPYLERLALAAQVPFSSMYVLNGGAHVPYFLPEYQNFGRFIPTSARRGSLGKGQDRFLTYLEEQTGQKLQRIPISHSKIGDIYTDGFSFINPSGEEIAHIAGSRHGRDIYVESSYIHPNFRQKGIGKLMYFDFNNHIFQNTGRTLHSSPYLHMSTVEIEPGSGVFISPSSKLWRGLKSNGLATLEGNGLNKYYVMRPPSSTIDATIFKSGGSIKIKKKNLGSFTRYCKGKVTEECIRKGKNSSNPTTRKRANFAANAGKWKHEEGGTINYLNYFNYECKHLFKYFEKHSEF